MSGPGTNTEVRVGTSFGTLFRSNEGSVKDRFKAFVSRFRKAHNTGKPKLAKTIDQTAKKTIGFQQAARQPGAAAAQPLAQVARPAAPDRANPLMKVATPVPQATGQPAQAVPRAPGHVSNAFTAKVQDTQALSRDHGAAARRDVPDAVLDQAAKTDSLRMVFLGAVDSLEQKGRTGQKRDALAEVISTQRALAGEIDTALKALENPATFGNKAERVALAREALLVQFPTLTRDMPDVQAAALGLAEMREKIADEGKREQVTGKLLRAFAAMDAPLLIGDPTVKTGVEVIVGDGATESRPIYGLNEDAEVHGLRAAMRQDTPEAREAVAGLLRGLVKGLATGEMPLARMGIPTDSSLRGLMTGLRTAQVQNQAALGFVAGFDSGDVAEGQVMNDLQQVLVGGMTGLGEVPSAQDIRNALQSLPRGDQTFETARQSLLGKLDAVTGQAAEVVRKRESYEAQEARTNRALGLDDTSASTRMMVNIAGLELIDEGGSAWFDAQNNQLPLMADDLKILGDNMGAKAAKAFAEEMKGDRDAGFQVARQAGLLRDAMQAEEALMGFSTQAWVGSDVFTDEAILRATGITAEEMRDAGITLTDDGPSAAERATGYGEAGFIGLDHLGEVHSRVTSAGATVLSDRNIQRAMGNEARRTPHAMATQLAQMIDEDALQLLKVKGDETALPADPAERRTIAYQSIVATAQDSMTAQEKQLYRDAATIARADVYDRIVDTYQVKAGLVSDRAEHMRYLMEQTGTGGVIEGASVRAGDPRGLRSAQAIIAALDVLDMDPGQRTADDVDTLVDQMRELTSFDFGRGRRPWYGKVAAAFGGGQSDLKQLLRDYDKGPMTQAQFLARLDGVQTSGGETFVDKMRDFGDCAEAIREIRVGIPARTAQADADLSRLHHAEHDLVEARKALQPQVQAIMARVIRAAIFENMPDARTAQSGTVNLSDLRDDVEQTLQDWGMDTDLFGPEIGVLMAHDLTGTRMGHWMEIEQKKGSFEGLLDLDSRPTMPDETTTRGQKFLRFMGNALLFAANKRATSEQFRTELAAVVRNMPEKSKFDMASGLEIAANTGKIPLDPSATAYIKGKLAGNLFRNFIIERGGSGEWKLVGLLGGGAKAGVEVGVAHKLAELKSDDGKTSAAIKVGAAAGLEGGIGGSRGFSVTFDAGKEEEMLQFLTEIAEWGKSPSVDLMEHMQDVSDVGTLKLAGKAYAKGYAKAEVMTKALGDGDIFDDSPAATNAAGLTEKSGAQNKMGAGIGAELGISGSAARKTKTTTSLDKRTEEVETMTARTFTAKASAYAKVASVLGVLNNLAVNRSGLQDTMDEQFNESSASDVKGQWSGGDATVSHELAAVTHTRTVSSTTKVKIEFDRGEPGAFEPMTKFERTERSVGNTRGVKELIASMATGRIADKMTTDPAFRDGLMEIVETAGTSGAGFLTHNLEIVFGLPADQVEQVNELMAEAHRQQEDGNMLLAGSLTNAAKKILSNRELMEPQKISLLEKGALKEKNNRGKAPLLSIDLTSSFGQEFRPVTVKV